MTAPPGSAIAKVREALAGLDAEQRESVDVFLIERLAVLIDTDPTVAAIRELRIALRELDAATPSTTTDALDEIQQARARRQHAASENPSRPGVHDQRG